VFLPNKDNDFMKLYSEGNRLETSLKMVPDLRNENLTSKIILSGSLDEIFFEF
jgi:hypothetical protein